MMIITILAILAIKYLRAILRQLRAGSATTFRSWSKHVNSQEPGNQSNENDNQIVIEQQQKQTTTKTNKKTKKLHL